MEGYGLHLLNTDGLTTARVAGFGLPRRLSHLFRPDFCTDPAAQFATSTGGQLIVTSGNLGISAAVHLGGLSVALWRLDSPDREVRPVAVIGDDVVIIADRSQLRGHQILTGTQRWSLPLLPAATRRRIRELYAGSDGTSLIVVSTANGGQVDLLSVPPFGGLPTVDATLTGPVNHVAISRDASLIAITNGTELRVYTRAAELMWSLPGDDVLGPPGFSADGRYVAAVSRLGTVEVRHAADGQLAHHENLDTTAIARWLSDGDLLLAGWDGLVSLRDPAQGFAPRWTTRLRPQHDHTTLLRRLAEGERIPSLVGMTPPESMTQPDSGSPNLLQPHNVAITTSDVAQPGGVRDVAWLHDHAAPPEGRLLFDWATIEALADRPDSREAIVLDFYRQLANVDSLTLDQDPALAESWLRDVEVQYWDRGQASWLPHATLVFDSATQTRGMPATPPTRKLRLMLPWGLVGNAAVRTVQVGGFFVGCSHPDIIAATVGNPVRVRLFDSRLEGEPGNANARLVGARVIQDPAAALPGCTGYLVVSSPQTGGPPYAKPQEVIQVAGPGQLDTIEDWDFNIGPGGPVKPTQFRWIQFAWRALTPTVTGLTLRVGSPPEIREGWNIVIGDGSFTTIPRTDILVPPPDPGQWQQWHYIRVDLSQYPFDGKPFPIEVQAMFLAGVGGEIAFDQIVLAATINDVPDPVGATPLLTLP